MIKVLSDYYDKNGNMCKVLSFSNGKFLCEFYNTGKRFYLEPRDLYEKNTSNDKAIEPEYYDDEEEYDFSLDKNEKIQDNIKEKSSEPESIYSDFM